MLSTGVNTPTPALTNSVPSSPKTRVFTAPAARARAVCRSASR